jgi:predicted hydrolase (HD superfamily)
MITRTEAFELLKKYNKDPFHIQHALTVEAVMKWYADQLGWELDKLLDMTLKAMAASEDNINAEMA